MRLKKEQIDKITHLVVRALREKKLVTFKSSEGVVLTKIFEIITKNLEEEEKIDNQVRKLMEQYQSQIASGQLDRQKVFQMIKKQLVKEKNFVI